MKHKTFGRFAAILLLATTVAMGCGKDENNGSVVSGDPPDALFDVNSLVFVEVALDQTDTQTVTILNVGKGDLRIDSIQLVEDTRDDAGGEEFAKGDDWINSTVLATDEQLQLSVKYTPTDKSPDTGKIVLQTNDPKFVDGIAEITLETPELAPRIFSKENVIFRRVPPVDADTRDQFWQLSEVQNIGQAPLDLTDVIVSPEGSDFSITYPSSLDQEADPANDGDSFPNSLQPGESFPIRIYFNPLDDLPSEAELIFFSNDPESPEYIVNLIGNSGSPCLQLNHEDEVNFGEGGIGFANNKTIIIENCSPSSDLTVTDIDVCTFVNDTDCQADSPIFQIKDGSLPGELGTGGEAIIGPQDSSNFVLTYTPENLDVSTGELTVKSDDPAKTTLVVPVIGKGTDNACPQAVAEAKLADSTRWVTDINTIPLKTVQFRGTNSIDQDGDIARYEWSLINKPTNSTARFTPSATVEEPSLFLDLAGEYVVELKVFDDKGTESCGDQALVTIRATPDEDIHVQLVWDTPGDADQTDAAGTDLDLHFLHPNGEWNSLPFDVFWNNPTSEWGAPGPSDDPSLDIDDTDGAGPENIILTDPEAGLTYAVGVYYYASSGYGPSYATLRIFLQGQQAYEYRDQYLAADKAFWYAATISWPSGSVFAVNQVSQDFPSRP